MKIAVLIKQVPGSESALPINDSQNWIDESSVTFVMNPPDNYALEEALILKEKIGEGEVVIISMGPNRVQKVIREGLAKGADRGIHLLQEGKIENDPLSVSKKISTALKEENFDLIFPSFIFFFSNIFILIWIICRLSSRQILLVGFLPIIFF